LPYKVYAKFFLDNIKKSVRFEILILFELLGSVEDFMWFPELLALCLDLQHELCCLIKLPLLQLHEWLLGSTPNRLGFQTYLLKELQQL